MAEGRDRMWWGAKKLALGHPASASTAYGRFILISMRDEEAVMGLQWMQGKNGRLATTLSQMQQQGQFWPAPTVALGGLTKQSRPKTTADPFGWACKSLVSV